MSGCVILLIIVGIVITVLGLIYGNSEGRRLAIKEKEKRKKEKEEYLFINNLSELSISYFSKSGQIQYKSITNILHNLGNRIQDLEESNKNLNKSTIELEGHVDRLIEVGENLVARIKNLESRKRKKRK